MIDINANFGYQKIGYIKLFVQIFAFYLFIFLFFVQTPIKEKKNRTKDFLALGEERALEISYAVQEKKDGLRLMLLLKLISQNVQNEQS